VAKSIWESRVRKDADEKNIGPRDQSERGFCPKERKDISNVETGKRGSTRVHGRTVEKRVHQTLKIAANLML